MLLAGALLSIELLAGMQRYLSQTVLPLMAAELDGRGLYGPLDAASQAPMFLMMPIGAWLLTRFRVGTLMLAFTALTVVGAVLCATAVSMPMFIAGTAVRALAAGALATIGMGAISQGLPTRYRQIVLAGMSGVWVISSLIGPVYAVAISSLLDWRWAMVLYLPLLLAARWMVARQMPPRAPSGTAERAPWRWASVLALGSAAIALPLGAASLVAVVLGGVLMLIATAALLPRGTFRARSGRRAGLYALLVTAAVYFGATMVLSVVAHDAFGLAPAQFGFIIAAPGFAWALAGLWTGTHPAIDATSFRRRAVPAAGGIALGVAVFAATALLAGSQSVAFVGLFTGAAVMGLSMGSLYPDLLGRCLQEPEIDDGVPGEAMAGAVVLAETVGMALATTLAYSWLGTGFGWVDAIDERAQVLYLALAPLAAFMVLRMRSAARDS